MGHHPGGKIRRASRPANLGQTEAQGCRNSISVIIDTRKEPPHQNPVRHDPPAPVVEHRHDPLSRLNHGPRLIATLGLSRYRAVGGCWSGLILCASEAASPALLGTRDHGHPPPSRTPLLTRGLILSVGQRVWAEIGQCGGDGLGVDYGIVTLRAPNPATRGPSGPVLGGL